MTESVWDYPRPPRLEPTDRLIEVWLGGERVASTRHAHRVLETSHPPVYYVPREDIAPGALAPADGRGSVCEWKGQAQMLDVLGGEQRVARGAWTYLQPTPAFAAIAGAVAFYPAPMDRCTVDGEVVEPQPGGFYGGWITGDLVGPFKGAPGTLGW
jgi:uncharacterized protein (DUF427 family)